jgi:hypothetical protein
MNERTENVYENKGTLWKNITAIVAPAKAMAHAGKAGFPLSRE